MNNLYQEMMKSQSGNLLNKLPNNVQMMIKMFKGMNNPQALIQQALNNNPQLKSVLDAANGDPEKAFRDMAKKMNVNPDEIINMLK